MTNELDQLRRLVEARAEVAKPRPYPATTPLALDRMGLGDACLDTDLPAILAAMQQAAAALEAAGIRNKNGQYVAEYFIGNGKMIDMPLAEWVNARQQAATKIVQLSDRIADISQECNEANATITAQAAEIERLSKLLGLHRDEINRISAAIATGNSPYPINTGLMLELAAREGK